VLLTPNLKVKRNALNKSIMGYEFGIIIALTNYKPIINLGVQDDGLQRHIYILQTLS